MNFHCESGQLFRILVTINLLTTIAHCTEIRKDLPANHKESIVIPSATSLAMLEGRAGHSDINAIEGKSKNSAPPVNDEQPIILGTSKVAIVYSEGKSTLSNKDKNAKAPRVVYPHKERDSTGKEENWRDVRVSSRDSYLEALEHSQRRKDRGDEGITTDRNKISKFIPRDDESEGPVYRHRQEAAHKSGSKEPYNFVHHDINDNPIKKNVARISYGGATPEPFIPTPSHSYSLPVQSFPYVHFNDNNQKNFHASPQISYPSWALSSPQNHHIYSRPNNHYDKSPSRLVWQSFSNDAGYHPPPAGIPQQAYGGPSAYATQDYSQQQHLPSLPSMDFIWPFALKLNLFTIGKILLKLVIFKMIVKFIGLICLLLFIPKLEIIKKVGNNDHSDDSDDSRKLQTPRHLALERLNILTAFITSSMEKYDKRNENLAKTRKDCTSFRCRMRKFISHEESWNDYARLLENYVAEEKSNAETSSVDL